MNKKQEKIVVTMNLEQAKKWLENLTKKKK
jgi:hypothetical protein